MAQTKLFISLLLLSLGILSSAISSLEEPDWFMMKGSKRIVKTDAGEMRVLKSYGDRILEKPLHIGFITMESSSLFIPHYMDSNLILFVHIGEAKVGFVYKREVKERKLKRGDVFQIPAGSTFYLVNAVKDQRLHVSFYIGGGTYPASVLSGFQPEILEAAFNGSMMAPHVNPKATEYGVILRGSGTVQIVYPNGTSAMNKQVKVGDVFFVPRYFPFCQVAAMDEGLEFFGFTTSSAKNRPQFLVGARSLLRSLMGPELAASFNVSEETLKQVAKAQQESVILPVGRGGREENVR
ncbi:vicilin-like seed storage protein [Senna tora]|uniref:Vicilin-like seed storage protein n=1 Tax=Senna tora TaxID=362788 RepID=A0A834TKG3_9FABA|nr:vicilin-like seed storage protein [Senna tora]